MLYISYYKPVLENSYIFHASPFPLRYATGNESVFMVPGSVWQMQQDVEQEDAEEAYERWLNGEIDWDS